MHSLVGQPSCPHHSRLPNIGLHRTSGRSFLFFGFVAPLAAEA